MTKVRFLRDLLLRCHFKLVSNSERNPFSLFLETELCAVWLVGIDLRLWKHDLGHVHLVRLPPCFWSVPCFLARPECQRWKGHEVETFAPLQDHELSLVTSGGFKQASHSLLEIFGAFNSAVIISRVGATDAMRTRQIRKIDTFKMNIKRHLMFDLL